ncbi:MAG: DUF2262 domain-containing protein [Pirellulaceae bacterium]|nr:DUF2262 domain-containing protein [Pirellulaceae bacterium]
MKKKANLPITKETMIKLFKRKCALDGGVTGYHAAVHANSSKIDLTIYTTSHQLEESQALLHAERLLKQFQRVERAFGDYVEKHVLPVVNRNAPKAQMFNRKEFLSGMNLEQIWIEDNGKTTLAFEGELLDGHCLMLYGDSEGNFHSFDTPG